MSRIHEALKRAEQERGAKPEEKATVAIALDLPVIVPPTTTEPVPGTADDEAISASPEEMTQLSWDAVVARCPQRSWTPVESMLFFDDAKLNRSGLEEFRRLRSRLYQLRDKTHVKTLLIGSALPGEGKSFLAANLAQVLVRLRGRRVLLIDADLRKPRLHEYLGAPEHAGLAEYLAGKSSELEVMQRGPLENLVFISGGAPVVDPAELIGAGRLPQLVQRAAPVFDWIVVDSPPVGPVSDAALIARACDGVLLVVQAASTPHDLAQRARHEFRGSPILGVVLNRAGVRNGYGAYYHREYATYLSEQGKTEQSKNL